MPVVANAELRLKMTESNQKDKDKPSENNTEASDEVNVPQDGEQEKNLGNAEQQNGDKSEATAAGDAADTQNPLMEDASKTSPAEEKPPQEMQAVEDFDLNLLLDIPLEITVELGRSRIQIQELLSLGPGSTISLSKLEGEPVDILANDKLIARGEVVLQNKKYGIRITEITSRMNRIKSIS
jgi:flagellar motor switch protein FliN/FliY